MKMSQSLFYSRVTHLICITWLTFHLQRLSKFKLDEELITDSGKFRFLDEWLPKMKEKVKAAGHQ